METNGGSAFRHRKSPSSERFLGIFSQPPSTEANGGSGVTGAGDELNEDEVFWTGDFSESNRQPKSSPSTVRRNHQSMGFPRPDSFGILAALPEDETKPPVGDRPVLYRKASFSSSSSSTPSPSSSSSRMIPAIPKPPQIPQEREYSQSVPNGKYHQSAPVNVPVLPKGAGGSRIRTLFEVEDDEGEDEMLPPHEIVARGSARSPMTTFSVLEGAGRTLKGRDLRQVRNAVWRKTGFLD
ncbi:PREDICTED: uncharacterized protein LOC104589216 [Nelumbo nucifera]|uniref:Uncharacterized protein LOC104589216 n=1 Tax=Nelumbo nucifera TaxID=4432 RepID=A0A1U7Z4P9_NELNU|nr:PREDICTED: uncharacterized protein LOC104589216 [Nelumbo nucifera]